MLTFISPFITFKSKMFLQAKIATSRSDNPTLLQVEEILRFLKEFKEHVECKSLFLLESANAFAAALVGTSLMHLISLNSNISIVGLYNNFKTFHYTLSGIGIGMGLAIPATCSVSSG